MRMIGHAEGDGIISDDFCHQVGAISAVACRVKMSIENPAFMAA